MSVPFLEGILLLFLVLAAILTGLVRDVLAAAVIFAAYSLAMSILWVLLRAPDVALTEAAIGAGLITVLFLGAIAQTTRFEQTEIAKPVRSVRWPAVGIVLAFAGAVALSLPSLPAVGDPTTPPHQHLSTYYLATAPVETGISNVVTAILAAYRGLDTFGEVVVVFAAGIGLLVVIRADTIPTLKVAARSQARSSQSCASEVTRTGIRVVVPFIATLGLFIGFHGANSAGGGFQGGVIAAAAVVLLIFSTSVEETRRWIHEATFLSITIGGIFVIALIGLGAIALGAEFLDYRAYPVPKAMTYGIEVVEVAIGATVTGVVIMYIFGLVPTDGDGNGGTSPSEEESS